jgi:hypothetical protein
MFTIIIKDLKPHMQSTGQAMIQKRTYHVVQPDSLIDYKLGIIIDC